MAMAEYIPKIQDRLRRDGYPVNASATVHELQLGPAGAAARERMRWEFMSKDKRSSVVVNEGFVVLQTTAYSDFETFFDALKLVVSTVDTAVGGLLIQRLGLRYVDAIVPNEGETWRDYVKPCLHGFTSPIFKEEGALRLHQTLAETPIGTILVRLHQNRDGAVLPPDLGTGALKAPPTKVGPTATITLLDIDHFRVCDSLEFKEEELEDVAWQLKTGAFAVFADHVVTEHALKVWA